MNDVQCNGGKGCRVREALLASGLLPTAIHLTLFLGDTAVEPLPIDPAGNVDLAALFRNGSAKPRLPDGSCSGNCETPD